MESQKEFSELNYNSSILEKVLYVGSVHPESTSFARYEALKKRASFIDLIDTKTPQSLLFKMKLKFFKGRGLNFDAQLNKKMNKKYSMIWVDKPIVFSEETLKNIKKNSNIKLIAHITDDIKTVSVHYQKIVKILELFDYVFTPNKFNIEELPNINFIYNELGYDHKLYKFSNKEYKYRNDIISFVGHYEPEYERKILEIAERLSKAKSKFIISISGSGWWRSYKTLFHKKIKVKFGWVSIEKLQNHYLNSKICIGLYSTLNRNKTSGRIYELAVLGVPIITEGNEIITSELNGNFIDLKSTQNSDDFKKIIYDNKYLNLIRLGAYDSVIKSKCSWDDRIYDALTKIK